MGTNTAGSFSKLYEGGRAGGVMGKKLTLKRRPKYSTAYMSSIGEKKKSNTAATQAI